MKYGTANSNFRHGNYSTVFQDPTIRQALAKDKLRKILNTPCDAKGELPFSQEEQAWAIQVMRHQPRWAHDVLRASGVEITNTSGD